MLIYAYPGGNLILSDVLVIHYGAVWEYLHNCKFWNSFKQTTLLVVYIMRLLLMCSCKEEQEVMQGSLMKSCWVQIMLDRSRRKMETD